MGRILRQVHDLGNRKADCETRSSRSDGTEEIDAPAQLLDPLLHYRQAEAGAPGFPADERLEKLIPNVSRNPRALILDDDL